MTTFLSFISGYEEIWLFLLCPFRQQWWGGDGWIAICFHEKIFLTFCTIKIYEATNHHHLCRYCICMHFYSKIANRIATICITLFLLQNCLYFLQSSLFFFCQTPMTVMDLGEPWITLNSIKPWKALYSIKPWKLVENENTLKSWKGLAFYLFAGSKRFLLS